MSLKEIKRYSDKTRIFINSFFILFATVFEKSIFFIINILLVRYLSILQFGEFTTALGYATFFSTFVDIGINQTIIRALNIYKNNYNENITNAFIIKVLLTVLVYSVMALSLIFTNYNRNTLLLILILGLVRIGNEFLNLFYAIFNAHEQFLRQSVTSSSFSCAFLVITILIIKASGDYFAIAITRFILVFIFIIILFIIISKNFKLKFNIRTLKDFVPQTINFGLARIFINSYQRINIIILSLMHGTIYSGFFSNGYIFFSSIFFIPTNFSRVLLPYLYKIDFKKNKDKFQFAFDVYSKILLITSTYLALVLFLFADNIILIIYGSKYLPSANVLKIIAIAIPALFTSATSGIIITALDKQKIRTIYQGIALIINCISNIIFIYFWKEKGAAVAAVITYLSLNLFYNRYLMKNNYININSIIKVIVISVPIIIICGLLYFLFLFKIYYIYSLIIITIFYWSLIYLIIINKNDIRIIKEAIGLKN